MYICIYVYMYQLSARRRTNQSIVPIVFPNSARAVASAVAVVSPATAVGTAFFLLVSIFSLLGSILGCHLDLYFPFWDPFGLKFGSLNVQLGDHLVLCSPFGAIFGPRLPFGGHAGAIEGILEPISGSFWEPFWSHFGIIFWTWFSDSFWERFCSFVGPFWCQVAL